MRSTAQPHQQSYRQENWRPEASLVSSRPTPPSSTSHAAATHVPLPPGAPALPAPQSSQSYPAANSSALSCPHPDTGSNVLKRPYTPQAYAHGSALNPQPPPAHPPLAYRLVNPYEQIERTVADSAACIPHDVARSNASRLSFGPGDPLFADRRASAPYPSGPTPLPSPSPRPSSTNIPALVSPPSPPSILVQRTSSSMSSGTGASNQTARNATATTSPHGTASKHEFDDCPGCRAEIEDAIKASLQSAQQEDEQRRRGIREQQDLDLIYAKTAEESERQRRLAQEEEQILQQAIEDSRREAEMQSQRSTQDEDLLIEESRQSALRQREQNARLEAEMLEAAKIASTTHEEQRRQELAAMRNAEKRALQLSLQEQEEEWARRESAERTLLEFLDQRRARSATPLASATNDSSAFRPQSSASQSSWSHQTPSSSVSSSSSKANDLEAEYWRFAGHDEAYQLALQMQQALLTGHTSPSQQGPSTLRARRPLPQTPQMSDGLGEPSTGSALKHDPRPSTLHPAVLHSLEDAPPAYTEAAQAGPSKRGSHPSGSESSAFRNPEKASSPRYDEATLEGLSRPVLQQRSSSSSSGRSHLEGRINPLSSGASLTALPDQSSPSLAPLSSLESSPAPHAASATPSISERESSQEMSVSKSSSDVSLAPEQRGQRALAGVEFGYGGLPFAPKLNKDRLPSAQSASTTASSFSGSASAYTKTLFPASILLSSVTKTLTDSGGSFFVIRAHSWKSLLRAIAWYGNSRVEAAPEEVAAASDRRSACLLRAEVEFVTPTRVDLGVGVAEYARAAQSNSSMRKNPAPAHVALCLSLLPLAPSKSSSSGEASAWLKSEEYQVIKRESRRLDAWYAGKGSARRLIQLARQPPALPLALVEVAQLLHASHTFSAACPSSGSTARHSPRDLHHAIERHDEGFLQKQKAMLTAMSALASQPSGLVSTSSLDPSNPRLNMQPSRTSISTEHTRYADEDDEADDDDDELDNFALLDQGLAANGSFDAQDKVLMGKRQRLKAKVKRHLAKRNADGRAVDEDLATWITPFDLSQHG